MDDGLNDNSFYNSDFVDPSLTLLKMDLIVLYKFKALFFQ